MKNKSNVTNKQKKRRTLDIWPSCVKPAMYSSVMKFRKLMRAKRSCAEIEKRQQLKFYCIKVDE